MPELRKDPIIDNWVIISTERGRRLLIDRRYAYPTNFLAKLVNWLINIYLTNQLTKNWEVKLL